MKIKSALGVFLVLAAFTCQAQMFTDNTYDEAVELAKEEKMPYMIDFTASWCLPCRLMDETVFRDYNVVQYANQNFIPIQLDMDDFDAMILKSQYDISQLPTILIFNYKGELVGRIEGLQTGTNFLEILKHYHTLTEGA